MCFLIKLFDYYYCYYYYCYYYYYCQIEQELVRQNKTGLERKCMDSLSGKLAFIRQWLSKCDLKIATESLLCAAQEEVIRTDYVKHYIDKTSEGPLCRLCGKKCESVQHLVCGCEKLAQKGQKRQRRIQGRCTGCTCTPSVTKSCIKLDFYLPHLQICHTTALTLLKACIIHCLNIDWASCAFPSDIFTPFAKILDLPFRDMTMQQRTFIRIFEEWVGAHGKLV